MTIHKQKGPTPTLVGLPPELTQAERERRAKSIHSIRQSQRIEGGDISPYAQELSQQYIEGKLTTEEMRARILKHYGVTVK